MKDLNFLKSYKFAHRGFHNSNELIYENSLEAFKNAIKHGYGIELDLSITVDKKWVCFHDNNLMRMTNHNLKINKVTFDSISSLNLGNSNNKIPLLIDCLDLINGQVPLLIEIKNTKLSNLNSLVDILKNYEGKYAIFSFSPRIINWFKRNHPNIIRGQISSYFNELKVPRFIKYFYKSMFFNKFNKPDFISYNIVNLPNQYVLKAKENNILCLGYTAKNIKQYEFALSYLDNVVFENFNP